MDIVYTKNIVFAYNCDRMNDKTFRKIVGKLSQKGLYLVSRVGTLKEDNYGYKNIEKTDKKYNLMIPSLSDKPIVVWGFKCDATKSVEGFEPYFDDVYYETIETVKAKKRWADVMGSTVTMIDSDDTLFETPNKYETYTPNYFSYDLDIAGELTMLVTLERNWSRGLELTFGLEWAVGDKQHPSMIEKVLDDMILDDITSIKQIIDRVLKSKDFGIDVKLEPAGLVAMNCWSNAKIDVKQECSLESRQKLGGSQ